MEETKMKKPDFEFLKEGNKYVFVMKAEDIERREYVDKQYVLSHYNELEQQRNAMHENIKKINKELENNKVEKDDELEKFIAMANNAAKYKKYLDAQDNLKATLDMLERINESIKLIELKVPEAKRQKK